MNITDNEKAILKGGCDSDYDNFCENPTWVFDAIDKSGLSPKVARGVISSLVKKGLVVIEDNEGKKGKGRSDDMTIFATDEGVNVCESLGYSK